MWLFVRVADANDARAQEKEFIPEDSISGEFLGLAAIFIWLRCVFVSQFAVVMVGQAGACCSMVQLTRGLW